MVPLKTYESKFVSSNHKYDKYFSKEGMTDEIKPWYHRTYSTDDMWKELPDDINFEDLFALLINGKSAIEIDGKTYDIEDILGNDSIIRDRILGQIEDITNIDSDEIWELYEKTWR